MDKALIFVFDFDGSLGGRQLNTLKLCQFISLEYDVFILVPKFKKKELIHYLPKESNVIWINSSFKVSRRNLLQILLSIFEMYLLNKRLSKSYNPIWFSQDLNHEIILSCFGFFNFVNRIFVKRGDANPRIMRMLSGSHKKLKSIIVVSNSQKEDMLRFVGDTNITVVNNFLDEIPDSVVDVNFDRLDIVVVGYFSENKNQLFIIDLLKELLKINSDYRVHFYGSLTNSNPESSRYLDLLRENIRNYNLFESVQFYDFVDSKDLIYSDKWICLVPSRSEGFGMSMIEAMSYGVPVLSSPNGGVFDILTGDLASNILSLNVSLWIERIELFRKRRDVYYFQREQAIKIVKENFLLENVGKEWLKVINTAY